MTVEPKSAMPAIVREALAPLLADLPVEHRMDVRNFARYAAGLAYSNGYADGHEDGTADAQDGEEQSFEAEVRPLLRVVGGEDIPAPRISAEDTGFMAKAFEADGESKLRCFTSHTTFDRTVRCDLEQGHKQLLHQSMDFPAGRMYLWAGDRLLTLVDVGAMDALLRSVLYDADPDMERLRRLAGALRESNLKDCT